MARASAAERLGWKHPYVIGQVAVVVPFAVLFAVRGFADVGGPDLGTTLGLVAALGTVPAIVTGIVAGFAGDAKPKLRRGLLVGLAAFAAVGAVAIALVPDTCEEGRDRSPRCETRPRDPLGAFAGAEYVVLFQVAVAHLADGVRAKHPVVRRDGRSRGGGA